MDLATIIGIGLGLALIIFAILLGSSLAIFLHIPSIMIVIGGSTAATLIAFKLEEIIGVIGVVKNAFFAVESDLSKIIELLINLSKKARREGLLAIDKEVSELEDTFMKTGLEMAIDGSEPESIKGVMETELSYAMERHKKGAQIFNALGMYAPAFGMIGTLIGLIAMLQKLEDPSQIGGGMAVALITTFYGALAANLIYLPIAGKLQNRSAEEAIQKEMIIQGVLAIQAGEHPKILTVKLLNFIPPKLRNPDLGE